MRMVGDKVGVAPMQQQPLPVAIVGAGGPAMVASPGAELSMRLHMLFSAIAFKFPASVCVVQAWLPKPSADEFSLYAEPRVAVVNDAAFQQFRFRSCHHPVLFKNSMTGRVWKTGAVQVVQNLRLVPPSMHPRVYLADSDLDRLGEALYIPVYNQMRPGSGPITVLEALLPAHSPEPVIAADLLSFISAGLATLKLSVSNPLPQPIKRSALCGRRARAPVDSAPDMTSTGLEQSEDTQAAGGSGAGSIPAVRPTAVKAISSPSAPTTATHSDAVKRAEEDTAAHRPASVDLCMQHQPSSSSSHPAVTGVHDIDITGQQPAGDCDPLHPLQHLPLHQQANMSPGSGSDGPSTTRVVYEDDELQQSHSRKVRRIGGGMVRSKSRYHVMIAPDEVPGDVSNCQEDEEELAIAAATAAAGQAMQ